MTHKLLRANQDNLSKLSEFSNESVRRAFSERLTHETDVHKKLILAGVAASYGDEGAREFFESASATNDAEVAAGRLVVLRHLLYSGAPADWVFESVNAAFNDQQLVVDAQTGSKSKVCDLSDCKKLVRELGYTKNPNSFPVLTALIHRDPADVEAISALGLLGDQRAVPILLDLLLSEVEQIAAERASRATPTSALVEALGRLKATAAASLLLPYLHADVVITALGEIGDEQAILPLRRIVAARGRITSDPEPPEKRLQERMFAARMALIKLEPEDRIPKWIDILQDETLDRKQRSAALFELRSHPDPRAVEPFLLIVKTDAEGLLAWQSIGALSKVRSKAAVEALIACFDVDYAGKKGPPRGPNPALFFSRIDDSLQTLTGKTLRPEKWLWEGWWNAEGSKLETLK